MNQNQGKDPSPRRTGRHRNAQWKVNFMGKFLIALTLKSSAPKAKNHKGKLSLVMITNNS
jgi:hypothetical protein